MSGRLLSNSYRAERLRRAGGIGRPLRPWGGGWINVRLLVVVLVGTAVVAGGLVWLHGVRVRASAVEARALGMAAWSDGQWSEATRQLGLYLSRQSNDVEAFLAYAQAHMAVRPRRPESVGRAVAGYERVLQLAPGNAEASAILAELYLAAGEAAEAERVARGRLAVADDDAAARVILARCLIRQRGFDSAAAELRRVIESDPTWVQAYDLLGSLQAERLGRIDAAEQTFEELVRQNSGQAAAHILRGRFYRRQGNTERALAGLEQAESLSAEDGASLLMLGGELAVLGRTAQARRQLEAAVEKLPDRAAAYTALAQLLLREGQVPEALEVMRQAEQRVDPAERQGVLPLAVQCHIAGGQMDHAERLIAELAQAGAAEELVLLLRAGLAAGRGHLWMAIGMLQELLGRQAGSAEAWLELGRLYARTGQWRRCVEAYRRYVGLRPESSRGQAQLAEALLKVGRYEEAEQAASRAGLASAGTALLWCQARYAQLAPAGPAQSEALLELASEARKLGRQFKDHVGFALAEAEVLHAAGRAQEADKVLAEAKQRYGDQPALLLGSAELHLRQGRQDQAAAELSKAVANAPHRCEGRIALARMEVARGNLDAGLKVLQEGMEIAQGGSRVELHLELGRTLLEAGRPGESLGMLAAAAERFADEVRIRLAMLRHPQMSNAPERAQRVIDRLKVIEGARGLNWRWEQARLWLARSDRAERAEAIEQLLKECVQADGGWAEPAAALARLRVGRGRIGEAIEIYQGLLAGQPQSASLAGRLIDLLERRGRYEQVDRILARFDRDAETLLVYRVRRALRQGRTDRAAELLEVKVAAKPGDVGTLCLLARTYLQLGRPDQAKRLVQAAEQAGPGELVVVQARVELELARGRPEAALVACGEFVERVGSFEAYQLRTQTYAALGRVDEAESEYRRLAGFEGRAGQGWTLLGSFLAQLGRSSESAQAWRRASQEDPEALEPRRRLITWLLETGGATERIEAESLLAELLARHGQDVWAVVLRARFLAEADGSGLEQAGKLLQEAVDRDPHAVPAWLALVEVARRQGFATQAERTLDRALAANPASTALLLRQAGLVAGEHPVMAVALARRAVQLEPGNPVARVVLARAMIAAGRDDDTLEMLGSWLASTRGVERLAATAFYAEQLCQRGRFVEAEEVLARARAVGPGHRQVLRAELALAAAQGQVKRADLLAERFMRECVNDVGLLGEAAGMLLQQDSPILLQRAMELFEQAAGGRTDAGGAWLGAAMAAHKLGKIEAAEAAFRRAYQALPSNASAANGLAWLLCEDRQDAEAALAVADRGVGLWPKDVHLLDTRGVILFRLGKLEQSQRDLQEALKLAEGESPTAVAVRFHLARTLAAQGEHATAQRRLAEALAMQERWGGLSAKERAEAQVLSKQLGDGDGDDGNKAG